MSNTTRTAEPRCADCGGRARAGQSFCDDCGSFLNWDNEADSTAATTAANTATAATAATPVTAAGSEKPAGTETPAAPAVAASPEPVAAAESEPGDTASETVLGKGGAAEPVDSAEAETAEVLTEPIDPNSPTPPPAPVPPDVARARALLVPVADRSRPVPQAPEVAPVLPGTPMAARPTVRQPGDDGHTPHGDACPWCGTGNQPDRHFCRRCAMRLAESPGGPQRRPWWRRLLDFRGREAPWAGERPRLRRDLGRIVRWTLCLAVAVALVVTVANEATPATHAVEDHFATRAQIHEITWSASHSGPNQSASLAGDSYNNTFWGSGYGDANTGQWLQANFTSPQHLLNVIITPCAGSESDAISLDACPSQLEAQITDNSGKVTDQQINLNDGQPQTFGMDARDVASVRFVIESVYGESPTKQVAIAEIEFFGPSDS
ncbi:zinc ribbon domain-containing protein [Streptacidiphilus sp. P02-A3a]|uniref:NADase-type glycan-binding domain-containing protein n=1 Tax=Streptacidiphilus sp. P02-A3a TaxID=2704468 RepID=UPI0015FD41AE|nr:zinc ribbon domain-containing protein [Streptacidiphilus sp. P02-A3a]QMU71004.1 zinc ribbon domain-containing protein [Streptacidiphilus sp. P02-A3a]